MKKTLLFLFGLMILVFILPKNLTAQHRVWRADDLNRLEVQSLFELISIISGETFATNDDATIQYNRGFFSAGDGFPSIYINGTQLYLQSWNSLNFHVIPVSVAQIDSVIITHEPNMANEFNDRGGIYIFTKRGEEGISFKANAAMGNRSGDPGPFVYTELASRNIERLGPIADATLFFANDKIQIQAGVKQFVHAVTDPLQFRRLTPFEFGDRLYRHEKIRSNSAFGNAVFKAGIFEHQLQTGITETADFLFSGLYGTEIPIDRNYTFISYKGKAEIHPKIILDYSISRNSNDLKEHPNKEDKWLRWDQTVNTGKFSVEHSILNGYQKAEIELQNFSLKDEPNEDRFLESRLLKIFHRFENQITNQLAVRTDLQLVKGDIWAGKAGGILTFKMNKNHQVEFSVNYADQLPEEDNSLWFWMFNKGFARDTLSDFQTDIQSEISTTMRGRFSWIASIDDHKAVVSAEIARFDQQFLLDYTLVPVGQRIQTGAVNFTNDLEATFIRFPVMTEFQFFPNIRTILNYTWSKQLWGENSNFSLIPTHKIFLNINWLPAESFKVWARLQAQSSSQWKEAEGIDGHEVRINSLQQDHYWAESDGRLKIDLGIRKYFWQKRVAFSLDLQNINNQVYRSHPVSPQHTFSVFLGMHLDLP